MTSLIEARAVLPPMTHKIDDKQLTNKQYVLELNEFKINDMLVLCTAELYVFSYNSVVKKQQQQKHGIIMRSKIAAGGCQTLLTSSFALYRRLNMPTNVICYRPLQAPFSCVLKSE